MTRARLRRVPIGSVLLVVVAVVVVSATSSAPDEELAERPLPETRLSPEQPVVEGDIVLAPEERDSLPAVVATELRVEATANGAGAGRTAAVGGAPLFAIELLAPDGEVEASGVLGGAVASTTVEHQRDCEVKNCLAPMSFRLRAIHPIEAEVDLAGVVAVGGASGTSSRSRSRSSSGPRRSRGREVRCRSRCRRLRAGCRARSCGSPRARRATRTAFESW